MANEGTHGPWIINAKASSDQTHGDKLREMRVPIVLHWSTVGGHVSVGQCLKPTESARKREWTRNLYLLSLRSHKGICIASGWFHREVANSFCRFDRSLSRWTTARPLSVRFSLPQLKSERTMSRPSHPVYNANNMNLKRIHNIQIESGRGILDPAREAYQFAPQRGMLRSLCSSPLHNSFRVIRFTETIERTLCTTSIARICLNVEDRRLILDRSQSMKVSSIRNSQSHRNILSGVHVHYEWTRWQVSNCFTHSINYSRFCDGEMAVGWIINTSAVHENIIHHK